MGKTYKDDRRHQVKTYIKRYRKDELTEAEGMDWDRIFQKGFTGLGNRRKENVFGSEDRFRKYQDGRAPSE